MVSSVGESAEDMQRRIWRLPTVDINTEFQELLGPLRDMSLHKIYDELVWRCNGDFEVREVMKPNWKLPVSEYSFKNYSMIFPDNKRAENLKDLEDVFIQAMRNFGYEFVENTYDPIMAFKAGVCASNVRAQFDTKTTWAAAAHLKKLLPLILSAAHRMTVQEKTSWEGYLDTQVPLMQFLRDFSHDLARMVWGYQSFVFFQEGLLKQGLEDLDTMQFMTECKSMAVKFFHRNVQNCRSIAASKVHEAIFPHLKKDHDERSVILDVIKSNFGFSKEDNTKAGKICLKAAIIFAYFCSLCETISFEDQSPLFN